MPGMVYSLYTECDTLLSYIMHSCYNSINRETPELRPQPHSPMVAVKGVPFYKLLPYNLLLCCTIAYLKGSVEKGIITFLIKWSFA